MQKFSHTVVGHHTVFISHWNHCFQVTLESPFMIRENERLWDEKEWTNTAALLSIFPWILSMKAPNNSCWSVLSFFWPGHNKVCLKAIKETLIHFFKKYGKEPRIWMGMESRKQLKEATARNCLTPLKKETPIRSGNFYWMKNSKTYRILRT